MICWKKNFGSGTGRERGVDVDRKTGNFEETYREVGILLPRKLCCFNDKLPYLFVVKMRCRRPPKRERLDMGFGLGSPPIDSLNYYFATARCVYYYGIEAMNIAS